MGKLSSSLGLHQVKLTGTEIYELVISDLQSFPSSGDLLLRASIELIEELVVSTEGKPDCKQWNSDDWERYERILPPEILRYLGKDKMRRLERTNDIVRQ